MKIFNKRPLYLFALVIFSFACDAQVKKQDDFLKIFQKNKEHQSAQNQTAFFNAFPATFISFQKLYGYDEKKGESPFYAVSKEHVDLFFKTSKSVAETKFIQKLIGIAKDGKWDADAVNYFQSDLRSYFFNHSDAFFTVLNTKGKAEVDGFWYFFSDGVHFNQDVYARAVKLFKTGSPLKQSYLNAVARVKKEDENH